MKVVEVKILRRQAASRTSTEIPAQVVLRGNKKNNNNNDNNNINKNAFDRRLTNRGSQSRSRNKSWSQPGSVNLDLDPMTLTYELDFDILKI